MWWLAVEQQGVRAMALYLTTMTGGVCVLLSVGFDQ